MWRCWERRGTRKEWLEARGCTANPRNSEPLEPLHGPFELFLSHRYCYPHSTVWKARFTVPSRKLRPQNKFSESQTPQRREGKTSSGSALS